MRAGTRGKVSAVARYRFGSKRTTSWRSFRGGRPRSARVIAIVVSTSRLSRDSFSEVSGCMSVGGPRIRHWVLGCMGYRAGRRVGQSNRTSSDTNSATWDNIFAREGGRERAQGGREREREREREGGREAESGRQTKSDGRSPLFVLP